MTRFLICLGFVLTLGLLAEERLLAGPLSVDNMVVLDGSDDQGASQVFADVDGLLLPSFSLNTPEATFARPLTDIILDWTSTARNAHRVRAPPSSCV
jgi:hypothetical protein